MNDWLIYHNPKCSKSRETLKLLESYSLKPQIIEYLKTPPDLKTLKDLSKKLRLKAKDWIRSKEDAYKSLSLENATEDELLLAMTKNPQLIERPIVVYKNKAVLGRPPENIKELLEEKIGEKR